MRLLIHLSLVFFVVLFGALALAKSWYPQLPCACDRVAWELDVCLWVENCRRLLLLPQPCDGRSCALLTGLLSASSSSPIAPGWRPFGTAMRGSCMFSNWRQEVRNVTVKTAIEKPMRMEILGLERLVGIDALFNLVNTRHPQAVRKRWEQGRRVPISSPSWLQ